MALLNDNYTISDNANWTRSYAVKNNGAAVDLTNCSFLMQARASADLEDLLVNLTTANGIAVTDAVNGLFRINVPPATIRRAAEGNYLFDILMVDSAGVVTQLVAGMVTLVRGVTQ